MFIPSSKYYNLFFINRNQSFYYLRLANKNNSSSFLIPISCTFCPWYADFFPRARHQQNMSSLFVNSGTYTSCSVVLFFQYNLSINSLRLTNNYSSPSFFIPISCTFCPWYADFLPCKTQTSAPYVFSFCQFWYVYILLYSIILPIQSIYLLLLVSSKKEQQSFLLHSHLLYILPMIRWLHPKSQTSAPYVFYLCQFWYVHILLYSFILPIQSIYLLLASSKQEQQSFLLHSQLLYILSMISWLPPKCQTSAPYVFSFCQFWYVYILLYSIILPINLFIYHSLCLANKNSSPSFFIPNPCSFCPW